MKNVTGSSTTSVTKITGAITSSTTASYGASSTQSSVRITSSTTASTTTKTMGATSSTTAKTGSTTVGSSSTPSTTVKSTGATSSKTTKTTGATSSTTTKTTSTTSSTTPKTSQGVSSTTPNINGLAGLIKKWNLAKNPILEILFDKENVNNIRKILLDAKNSGIIKNEDIDTKTISQISDTQTSDNLKKLYQNLSENIYEAIQSNLIDKEFDFTYGYRIFDIKLDAIDVSLEYYGDIKTTNGNNNVSIEVSKKLSDEMSDFFDIHEIAITLGKTLVEPCWQDGELWAQMSDDEKAIKMNLSKLLQNKLELVYEKKSQMCSSEKGDTEITLGTRLEVNLQPYSVNEIVKEYGESLVKAVKETRGTGIDMIDIVDFIKIGTDLGEKLKKVLVAVGTTAVAFGSVLAGFLEGGNTTNGFNGMIVNPIKPNGGSMEVVYI